MGVIFLCQAIIEELLFSSRNVTDLDRNAAAVGQAPQLLKVVDKI